MPTLRLILVLIAVVLFAVRAFGVKSERVDLLSLGLAFFAGSTLT